MQNIMNTKLSKDKLKELIATKIPEAKSRNGVIYTILSVKDTISGIRQTTKKEFNIDTDEFYEAYKNEDLTQLDTLTNDILKEKYGLFMAQSPTWAILKRVYELTSK